MQLQPMELPLQAFIHKFTMGICQKTHCHLAMMGAFSSFSMFGTFKNITKLGTGLKIGAILV